MKRIQSKKHKLRTYEIDKISLSSVDNKRYVLDDGIHWLLLIIIIDDYYWWLLLMMIIIIMVIIKKDCNKLTLVVL